MNDKYKEILKPMIENRLVELWNKADNLENASHEYKKVVDEVDVLRQMINEYKIEVNEDVRKRF